MVGEKNETRVCKPLPYIRDLKSKGKSERKSPKRTVSISGRLGNILYKGVETSPLQTCFRIFEGKPERESPKRTISVNGGLELL